MIIQNHLLQSLIHQSRWLNLQSTSGIGLGDRTYKAYLQSDVLEYRQGNKCNRDSFYIYNVKLMNNPFQKLLDTLGNCKSLNYSKPRPQPYQQMSNRQQDGLQSKLKETTKQ